MNTEREKEIRCNIDSVLKVCSVCKIKRDSFRVATYFVCAFFSLETNRVTRVCNKCYDEAENHQSVLVNMLIDNKSIFSGPKKRKNPVEIVDLDDERFLDISSVFDISNIKNKIQNLFYNFFPVLKNSLIN